MTAAGKEPPRDVPETAGEPMRPADHFTTSYERARDRFLRGAEAAGALRRCGARVSQTPVVHTAARRDADARSAETHTTDARRDGAPPPSSSPTGEDDDESGGTGTAMALESGLMGKKDSDRAEGQYKMKKNQEDPQLARRKFTCKVLPGGRFGNYVRRGTVRGMHFQSSPGQGKLVRVAREAGDLANGREVSALEIQSGYLTRALRYNETKGIYPNMRLFGYPSDDFWYSILVGKSTTRDENYELEFAERGRGGLGEVQLAIGGVHVIAAEGDVVDARILLRQQRVDLLCGEPQARKLVTRPGARPAEAIAVRLAVVLDRRMEAIAHVREVALQLRTRNAERFLELDERHAAPALEQLVDLVEALGLVHYARASTRFSSRLSSRTSGQSITK